MADEFKDASPRPWTVDEDGCVMDARGGQVGFLVPPRQRRRQNTTLLTRSVNAFGPMREALVYILSEHAAQFGKCGCGICTRASEALRAADGEM